MKRFNAAIAIPPRAGRTMLSSAGLSFGTSIFASAASFRAAAGRATPRLARGVLLAVAMTYSGRGLTYRC
jgi:hypothetical protein